METLAVNSKISDILFSTDELPGARYCLLRKENGDLIGADELFNQSGKSSLMKSLITKHTYHVCLYHRSSGEVVRRLKVLKKQQHVWFFKRLKNKLKAFYFRTLFSSLVVSEASFCNISNQVEISFTNGKILKLNFYDLI
jgi:hypothetical protein